LIKTDIGDEGLIELLKGGNFIRKLENLQLASNDIGDFGVEFIAKCPQLSQL
jgi:hypothetical protein